MTDKFDDILAAAHLAGFEFGGEPWSSPAPASWATMTREERIEAVTERVRQGQSSRQIAAALQAETRNVIIGFARRAGIKFGKDDGRPRPLKTVARKRRAGPPMAITRLPAIVVLDPDTAPYDGPSVAFVDLARGQCHFPVGSDRPGPQMRCCGGPRSGEAWPYCAHHLRVASRPGMAA